MRRIIFIFFLSIQITTAYTQVPGCTDPLANNYNPAATVNDGSCTYNSATVSATSSVNLSDTLIETSGLVKWNGWLWTHNDNSDINLYALDTGSGNIIHSFSLSGTANYDWEEITQDSNYLYVGDFGNNANGNRTNLHILRIEKNSVLLNAPVIDTIWFSYADQIDFTPTGGNNTDFDCEAFVAGSDSLYLFTKQWVSNGSRIYALPKVPGTHSALPHALIAVQGLITGACLLESQRLVVLSGYSSLLQPFVFLLYDYHFNNFASGNKRKLGLSLAFHQVEGVTTGDGRKLFITNEKFSNPPLLNIDQQLHVIDISAYTGTYLDQLIIGIRPAESDPKLQIYPNPAGDFIMVKAGITDRNCRYSIHDLNGKQLMTGKLGSDSTYIEIRKLKSGTYIFNAGIYGKSSFQVLKK